MKIRKSRKHIAAAPAADSLPSTPPAVAAAPEPVIAPEPAVAAPDAPTPPSRRIIGRPHHALPLDVHPLMTLGGCLINGTPAPKRADAPILGAASFTAADVPELLATAARLLAFCGASNLGTAPDAPHDAPDSLVADYLSNRETETAPDINARNYFERNRVSDLDRMMYPVRAAERIVYTVDRIRGRKSRRVFCGGYNGTTPTTERRDSVALAVADLMKPATP